MLDYPKLRNLTKEKYASREPKIVNLLLNNLNARERREQKRLEVQAKFRELKSQLEVSLLQITEVSDYYNNLLHVFTTVPSSDEQKKMFYSLGKITIFLKILVDSLNNLSKITEGDDKNKLIYCLNNLAFLHGQLSLLFENFIADIHSTYFDGDRSTSVWEKCKLLYKDPKYRYQEVKHSEEKSKVNSALIKISTKLQQTITSLIYTF